MNFLRNSWYMAGWASELAAGQLLVRRLLDEPVVMFRDAAGVPKALYDRCPHRFVPLSAGRVQAERAEIRNAQCTTATATCTAGGTGRNEMAEGIGSGVTEARGVRRRTAGE